MWAVADNQYASLAGVNAAGRTMRHAVDKKSGIAGLERNFAGTDNIIERIGTFFEDWMKQVGFVAPGDDHCRPVTRAYIGQRQQNIDLATAELIVVVAELGANSPFVRA